MTTPSNTSAQQPASRRDSAVRGLVGALIAYMICSALLTGCEEAPSSTKVVHDWVAHQAKDEPKVGVLRALQTVSTARKLAVRTSQPGSRACRLHPPQHGAFRYRFELSVTRHSAAGAEVRWHEKRSLERDADGQLQVRMDADFRTALGLGGERHLRWIWTGERSFHSDDGQHFWQQPPAPDERRRLLGAGMAPLQSLLDAVHTGWRPGETGQSRGRWLSGGAPLHCGPRADTSRGWLRRLRTRATPLEAELVVPEGRFGSTGLAPRRRLEANWQLEDGSRLEVSFEDQLDTAAANVQPPPEAKMVDVQRDRSWQRAQRLLDVMAEDRWIERSNTSAPARGKNDGSK